MKAVLFALASSLCFCAYAADKACSRADSANAQKVIDNVVTWSQLQKAWTDYRHCDTGEVAELYTDALLRLAVDWKDAGALAAAAQKNPEYKAFIFDHLKSPAAKDDRTTIRSRAKTMCPAGQDAFCAELADAMAAAK